MVLVYPKPRGIMSQETQPSGGGEWRRDVVGLAW